MRIWAAAFAMLLLAPGLWGPARAAGGAHVVDDSEVEAPGHCHLESWISGYGHDGGLVNIAPACTPYAPGEIEVDTALAQGWSRGVHQTFAGAGGKITLRPEAYGLGIGASAFLTFDAGHGHLALATFNLPVTLPISKTLRASINIGTEWSQALHRWTMTGGAQAEITLRANMELMAEALFRSGQQKGWQIGPRWTIDKGRMDIDLLVAHDADGETDHAFTMGLTVRR